MIITIIRIVVVIFSVFIRTIIFILTNSNLRYNDVISASDMVDQSPVRGENKYSSIL